MIKQATDAVTGVASRVSLVIKVSLVVKADIRPGYTNQLEEKVQRVEEQLRA